ncbi:DUF948 domain-containing protein [Hazenella coriacea]|uniref:Uncharacterized protein DUF948 n=1 Tax=Hazenella coriacea TaxID=1179467 RepID=A0A4R3LA05_9BACL|nr:DUF948 domain-containing protein [Hazenella coriacea]TCS95074.1 uncharacterized protein DUF948 [Hazenella coriacea]
MIVSISIGVIAIAVVVLVIFLIRSLISFNQTIHLMNQTLNELKGKVEVAVDESTQTLKETRYLVEDFRQKSQQADAVFQSMKKAGESLEEVSTEIVRQAEVNKSRLSNLVALVGAGIDIARNLQKPRK